MSQTKKLVSNKGTLEVEVERHGAGVVIRTIDTMKHTQKSISVFDELIPGLVARLTAIASTRSPTLRGAVAPKQSGLDREQDMYECGNCGVPRFVHNGILEACPNCGDDETELSLFDDVP